jgi:threonylcarbamoyladenosine tRNA methylthiotransferase MtaB
VRYSILTFGCRVNQADSLGIEAELSARGGVPAEAAAADVVFVNTCSVTASADQGARQAIRRISRENPGARIVVTGCYATRSAGEVERLPGVTAVVSNLGKDTLVADLFEGQTTADRFGDGDGACGATIAPGTAGRTAWTLRVQTGCEERCSYCVIPATRGPSRSRAVAGILAELDRLAAAGYREVALTGVHLGAFGRDLSPASSLAHLLEEVAARAYPILFRVSSLEPMDLSPRVVDLVLSSRAFAPHFHLPLQHGSDSVLGRMRRPYTLAQYAARVDAIRSRAPHAAIGSDVIVGFPGETDEEFEATLTYVRRSPLTHLHVFCYSDRPGTEASRLDGKVHGAVARRRASELRTVGRELAAAFRASQAGATRRALTLEDGTLAVTDNYIKVRIPPGHGRNEWVDVVV